MFPGSFDPVTNGHIDIIKRLSPLYEKVYVVVAENRRKKCLFSSEDRKDFIVQSVRKLKNVEVLIWDGLLVDCAKAYNCGIVVRGIRNVNDFNYEFEVTQLNKSLCPELEFIYMLTSPDVCLVSSSNVKELASFGSDVCKMVPKQVSKALTKRFKG